MSDKRSSRLFTLVLGLVIMTLILSAFAPAGATLPQTKQVLRIITGSSGSASFDFNVLQAGSDLQNWQTFLYMPVMYFDNDLKLKPGVFKSWEGNKEATEWTFKLDPRAKFSDGSALTSADVKGTWEVQSDPANTVGRAREYYGNIKGFADMAAGKAKELVGVVAVDPQTIKVTLVNPDPVFHFRVATAHTNPVKAEHLKKFGYAKYWLPESKPPSSGPFMLAEYNPDLRTAKMVKNPNWWFGEGPYIDEITFVFVVDQQTMAAMIQNNQADVALAKLAPEMATKLPDMFRPVKAFGFNAFWLNVSAEPTNDIKVRQALAQSVDWDAVFKATFPGSQGVPTNQILDPDFLCVDKKNSWYKYDVEAAKKALADSKYKTAAGLPKLRITPRGGDVYNNRALEAIMGFWKQNLGITNIEFKVQPSEFGETNQKLINLTRDDVVIRFPDSTTYMINTAHSTGGGAMGLLVNYKNAEVDKLLDQAAVIAPEDAKRCELTLQAQALFMNDYGVLPFGKNVMTINSRDYVKNYFKGPDVAVIEPWNIKIEKK